MNRVGRLAHAEKVVDVHLGDYPVTRRDNLRVAELVLRLLLGNFGLLELGFRNLQIRLRWGAL